tara:strand:- start:85 stop:282 length:198 start_codon:yes stop_codon:yes gene_type:complete
MKIYLGKNEYLSASVTDDNLMSISIKAKKNANSYILVSSKIDLHDLEGLISFLVANKIKILDKGL